jgi:hypothetical protein
LLGQWFDESVGGHRDPAFIIAGPDASHLTLNGATHSGWTGQMLAGGKVTFTRTPEVAEMTNCQDSAGCEKAKAKGLQWELSLTLSFQAGKPGQYVLTGTFDKKAWRYDGKDVTITPKPESKVYRKPASVGDPEDGFDTPCGKVHRGGGTYVNPKNSQDTRPSIYVWVERPVNPECKNCKWYQVAKPEATLTQTNGKSRDVTGKLKDVGAIEVKSTGAFVTFGQWNEDYYKNVEDNHSKIFPPVTVRMPGSTPGSTQSITEGPFTDNPNATTPGFVDAPHWGPAVGNLSNGLRKALDPAINPSKRSNGAPPAENPFELVIRETFRDFLYCLDKTPPECLGYTQWTQVEVLNLQVVWVESKEQSEKVGAGTPYNSGFQLLSDTSHSEIDSSGWSACK